MDEIPYTDFRTGFTFNDIFWILKSEARRIEENGNRMFITRHTVLGRWRQYKLQMYHNYIEDYYENKEFYLENNK